MLIYIIMEKEKEIAQAEKAKYEKLWKSGSYRSQSAEPFADLLLNEIGITGDCLEIGFGDGTTMAMVNGIPGGRNVNCYGIDITLEGAKTLLRSCWDDYIYEGPVWNMPYKDRTFRYTFSTDLLEHIPTVMIEDTIKEISRVTWKRGLTIHQIATFPMGNEHLTVQPMQWWKAKFGHYCEVPFKLIERKL